MRGKTTPEDKIPGIVLARLKQQLNFTFYELSIETGIPESTLSGVAGLGSAICNPSRIEILAKYFRDIHCLEYVTSSYLLSGGQEDQGRIELLKKQEEIQKETPPFFELTEQTA